MLEDTPVRALLIDPHRREIREVRDLFNTRGVLGQYLAQGEPGEKRAPLCAGPTLADGVFSYCDDEGRHRPDQAWCWVKGYPHVIPGYCLVIGRRNAGDEADCPGWVTPELLREVVLWTDPAEAQANATPLTFSTLTPDGFRVVAEHHTDFTDVRPL